MTRISLDVSSVMPVHNSAVELLRRRATLAVALRVALYGAAPAAAGHIHRRLSVVVHDSQVGTAVDQ